MKLWYVIHNSYEPRLLHIIAMTSCNFHIIMHIVLVLYPFHNWCTNYKGNLSTKCFVKLVNDQNIEESHYNNRFTQKWPKSSTLIISNKLFKIQA